MSNEKVKKAKTCIEKAADDMATLDAAGFGVIALRSNSETDARRVVEMYRYKKTDASFNKNNVADNIYEAVSTGMVRNLGKEFDWSKHGYSEKRNYPDHGAKNSLITKLSECIGATRKNRVLIYIPDITIIDSGKDNKDKIKQTQINLIKEIARLKRRWETNALVVIAIADDQMCEQLAGVPYILDIPCPDYEEIVDIINDVQSECSIGKAALNSAQVRSLAEKMRGLREDKIRSIFYIAYSKRQSPSKKDLEEAAKEAKKQLIEGVAGLKWEDRGKVELGGLTSLTEWIKSKRYVFLYPRAAKEKLASPPKGILLCGLPGTGKSTLACYIAEKLGGIPMLRLDISMMKDRLVGNTEAKCEAALRTVESVAPCVLMLDEVEKVLSGVGSGNAHETTMGMFSMILNWMQEERDKPIFVIATANKTDSLPSEFMRKGRFDEVFFVGVSTENDCREILKIHLDKKRDVVKSENWDDEIDENGEVIRKGDLTLIIDEFIAAAERLRRFMNGADIESMVNAAFCRLFSDKIKEIKDPNTLKIIDSNSSTITMYTCDEVERALIAELESTRTYFDGNLRTTAKYWIEMYTKNFRDAGGKKGILPTEKGCFDETEFTFEKSILFDDRAPHSLNSVGYKNLLDEYLAIDDNGTPKTNLSYDRALRYTLASAIYDLKPGRK